MLKIILATMGNHYENDEKTVASQISVMRKNQAYLSTNCFRLSGRVCLQAFEKF
ncbi:hypothetical protein RU86_GL000183 [Lactococcus piscium]|uniref:Uncharacterized protein n=1 Tax=Pseudolactococcus piscium TaxID=1364 RepID=A0A2A5S605_9LACT|nr:hypothetical protein [Lactococcus piscium]PCS08947.1 hypothetical protein RU86_GL000183 [Lactococcus piscium]